jgi:hypothetical protein
LGIAEEGVNSTWVGQSDELKRKKEHRKGSSIQAKKVI